MTTTRFARDIKKFQSALQRLETSLIIPIVPGEMEGWIAALCEAAELAGALLWRQIETVHESDFAEIVEEDPEMFRHVEQMKEKDVESLNRLEALLDRIGKLKKIAPQCEPDEAVLKGHLESVIEHGLDWVIRAKKQEKARETWLIQAFNCERGDVD